MLATDRLKEEHRTIEKMLEVLENVCARLKKGEEVSPVHLDQILDFIKIFVDKCHHAKEEDALFPALEAAGMPREGGPIAVMLSEHDIGREAIRRMGEGIERYKQADASAIEQITENASNYIQLLRDHIYKEDNILYAIANAHLPTSVQEQLLREFEALEQTKIGEGKHEEFHNMLQELTETYLS